MCFLSKINYLEFMVQLSEQCLQLDYVFFREGSTYVSNVMLNNILEKKKWIVQIRGENTGAL